MTLPARRLGDISDAAGEAWIGSRSGVRGARLAVPSRTGLAVRALREGLFLPRRTCGAAA
jgi:tryptophan synthase alpha subunit